MTLLGSDAVLRVSDVDRCQEELDPLEQGLATGASMSRLRELRAGRALARQTLRELGEECAPILMGSSGEPLWPSRVCGSISHTRRYVSVLVARGTKYESVGIDIDDERSLGPDALAEIALAEEREPVEKASAHLLPRDWGSLVFSAKEALFKCQYPVTGFLNLQFLDVRLSFDQARGLLRGHCVVEPRLDALTAVMHRIELIFVSEQGVAVACALLPR